MTDDNRPPRTFKGFLRWAMTPPQAWGVYLLAVLLVWLLSFYAGTLKPKEDAGPEPAADHGTEELGRRASRKTPATSSGCRAAPCRG